MRTTKVMWLLNHTTLRGFELEQLRTAGVTEIYLPKHYPFDEGNLCASVDHGQDATLSIPQRELDVLNAQDWYGCPSDEAWSIANRYFDVAFIGFVPKQVDAVVRRFQGSVVLRVFGVPKYQSYSQLLYEQCGEATVRRIRQLGGRFWFGAAHRHLKDDEEAFLASRDCHLPCGLVEKPLNAQWQGDLEKILFICPGIGTSPGFERAYKDFILDFSEFDYSISGMQPVWVADEKVLGFVTVDEHVSNMQQHRLMLYTSTEPNFVHYHPFEAVRLGMPLLFMAGGMLDRLGGLRLPGRCLSVADARKKARRIMDGDIRFIEQVRKAQARLLDSMMGEHVTQPWQDGLSSILNSASSPSKPVASTLQARKRIALIVPIGYRGGSLRGAKLLALALMAGSQEAGEPVEVTVLHLDEAYDLDEFNDLPEQIKVSPYRWRYLDSDTAQRAMIYAGHAGWQPNADRYKVVDDNINALQDHDLWVVISDRLDVPLLPVKPVVLMVYDYLQRYVPILPHGADQPYLDAARRADKVMVTTDFTYRDALQYAGVDARKLHKLPMLAPRFSRSRLCAAEHPDYFLWTTNPVAHKNHQNALKALKIYYERLGGQMFCKVTGPGTRDLFKSEPLAAIISRSPTLRKKLKNLGELSEPDYERALAGGAFLWHAGAIDNGTFSVIEAAGLGVPALSSDYPPMREVDRQFSLNLSWMPAHEPTHMAAALKDMELHHASRRALLPSAEVLEKQGVEHLAQAYWQVIRTCL